MEVKSGGYENLVTMLAVGAIAVMVGYTIKMIEQHSMPFVVSSVEPIKGYVRPSNRADSTQESMASKTARLTVMANNKKPVIRKQDEAMIKERFNQAVSLLHAKEYEYAIMALDQILKVQRDMPEAYVNMGYAYLGLEDYNSATSAFQTAIDLRLNQINAYYGLAMAYEGNRDLEGALGAMRSFIHLSEPKNKHRAKARAAVWEWEAELGRIKGVSPAPPGSKSPLTKSGGHTK